MKSRKGMVVRAIEERPNCGVPVNPLVNINPKRLKKITPRFAR